MDLAPELGGNGPTGLEPDRPKKFDPYLDILDKADKVDPGNAFLASCRQFYLTRGFLSNNQLYWIKRTRRTRRRRY